MAGPLPPSVGAPPPAAPFGQPGQPGQAMVPNPAYAQWQQARQMVMKIEMANQAAQKKFDDACALIKKDGIHGFRIDIEADSTVAPDEQAEKAARTEFMEKFVPFLEVIVPMCMGNPPMADVGEQMTLFVMHGFKVSRPLEDAVTKMFEALKAMPPQPPGGAKPGQQGQGGGADSPQDLAVRAGDTKARLQIAQQQTAAKLAQVASQERIANDKLAMEAQQHRDTMAADLEKEADQRVFRDVRASALEAREASRLT